MAVNSLLAGTVVAPCNRMSKMRLLLFTVFWFPCFLYADWAREFSFQAGLMITPAGIGEEINYTGGEKLLAEMRRSFVSGARVGLYENNIGFEANMICYCRQIAVENEFGVEFPDHATSPLSLSGAFVVQSRGRIRPYASIGGGMLLFSIDLDNTSGQEWYFVPSVEFTLGVKFHSAGNGRFFYSEYRTSKASGRSSVRSFRTQTLLVGFGVSR